MCIYCWTIVAVCIHRTFSESFSMCGVCFFFSLFLSRSHTNTLTLSIPILFTLFICKRVFAISLTHVRFLFCACNSFDFSVFNENLFVSMCAVYCQKKIIIIKNLEKGAQIKLQKKHWFGFEIHSRLIKLNFYKAKKEFSVDFNWFGFVFSSFLSFYQ